MIASAQSRPAAGRSAHRRLRAAAIAWLSIVTLALAACRTASTPRPLPAAHAHNDYEHPRPLLDALARGFCSIEADVYLVDGALLVAHDRKDLTPERTLAALYLDPLRARVSANGGRIYRGGPTLTLLVDIKSEASSTYAALHAELQRYATMLTTYRGERREEGAVNVIVSGNRAVVDIAAQELRYAAVDGRAVDLEANPSAVLVPWVSENWQRHFTWRGDGDFPEAERLALHQWVQRAHAQQRKVRFWNTPERPELWRALLSAGVDLIGTDQLDALAQFLHVHSAHPGN